MIFYMNKKGKIIFIGAFLIGFLYWFLFNFPINFSEVCSQLEVKAQHRLTRKIETFGSPCVVPLGWKQLP